MHPALYVLCVVLCSLSVVLCWLCKYFELCLLYCIFCTILYTVNIVKELFKSGIVHYCQHSVSCVSPVFYFHYCQRSASYVLVLYCISTAASAMCCVYHSCIVSPLLPAQCVVCVSPVLYLHYCQQCMMRMLALYCNHACLLNCQRSVLCMWVLYCICTSANAMCCVCKSCIVFALLPVQCAMWGLWQVPCFVCSMYCQFSLPYVGYNKSSYYLYFAIFYYFTHSH